MAGSRSQAKGKANKIAGATKQAVGKATGNRKLRTKGTVQRAKGTVQDAVGRSDRKIRGAANSL
jgi:uncharacterized protein YjbJ (UPF0337 family)